MKIVHLCLSCFFIDNYSYQENMLPKYHVKMGHDVTVIASLVSFNKEGKPCFLSSPSVRIAEDGYKVIRLGYKRPVKVNKVLRKYIGLYETLSLEKPDIIFTHGVALGDTDVIVKYLKEHRHVKLFGDHHGDYINSATNYISKNVLHKLIYKERMKAVCVCGFNSHKPMSSQDNSNTNETRFTLTSFSNKPSSLPVCLFGELSMTGGLNYVYQSLEDSNTYICFMCFNICHKMNKNLIRKHIVEFKGFKCTCKHRNHSEIKVMYRKLRSLAKANHYLKKYEFNGISFINLVNIIFGSRR